MSLSRPSKIALPTGTAFVTYKSEVVFTGRDQKRKLSFARHNRHNAKMWLVFSNISLVRWPGSLPGQRGPHPHSQRDSRSGDPRADGLVRAVGRQIVRLMKVLHRLKFARKVHFVSHHLHLCRQPQNSRRRLHRVHVQFFASLYLCIHMFTTRKNMGIIIVIDDLTLSLFPRRLRRNLRLLLLGFSPALQRAAVGCR